MTELIKYLRESEAKKTATSEKEKNELEKEKKKATPEDKQVFFSTVDSQTILPNPIDNKAKLEFEKLIGHTPSSKYVLPANMKASAGPHNPMSFYDSLKKRADLQGENPSTGQLSLSTNAPIQITQPSAPPTTILRHTSHPNNAALTDLLRSRLSQPAPEPPAPRPASPPEPPAPQAISQPELPGPQIIPEETKEETVLQETKDDEFFDLPEEEAPPEEESQAPQEDSTSNEPTQAQQLIGMDSTTIPTAQRPITDISPPIHLEDVIGGGREKTGEEQSDEAIRMIQEALSPKKAASGEAAEDTTSSSNPTKPPYTEDEISKMSVKDLGAIVEQVGITDDQGIPLVFNGSRVHRITNTSYQLKKGEIAQFVALHYYPK
jgi:hypothetical protein